MCLSGVAEKLGWPYESARGGLSQQRLLHDTSNLTIGVFNMSYDSHTAKPLFQVLAIEPDVYQIKGYICFDELLELTAKLIKERAKRIDYVSSPQASYKFLSACLAGKENEVFAAIFLDTQNGVICFEELFHGTLDSCAVHPREVVKRAIELNAASVIFAHNHPSGKAEPSSADKLITERLKSALTLIDVRVLDHFVIGVGEYVSFAERGLI